MQIVEDFGLLYPQAREKFCTTMSWPHLSEKLQPVLHAVKERELRKLIDLYLCTGDGADTTSSIGLYSSRLIVAIYLYVI